MRNFIATLALSLCGVAAAQNAAPAPAPPAPGARDVTVCLCLEGSNYLDSAGPVVLTYYGV